MVGLYSLVVCKLGRCGRAQGSKRPLGKRLVLAQTGSLAPIEATGSVRSLKSHYGGSMGLQATLL